jgi:hypothetical protein
MVNGERGRKANYEGWIMKGEGGMRPQTIRFFLKSVVVNWWHGRETGHSERTPRQSTE